MACLFIHELQRNRQLSLRKKHQNLNYSVSSDSRIDQIICNINLGEFLLPCLYNMYSLSNLFGDRTYIVELKVFSSFSVVYCWFCILPLPLFCNYYVGITWRMEPYLVQSHYIKYYPFLVHCIWITWSNARSRFHSHFFQLHYTGIVKYLWVCYRFFISSIAVLLVHCILITKAITILRMLSIWT